MTETNLFQTIAKAMRSGDKVRFEIERNGDAMSIMFQPILRDQEDAVPDEAKPIRAALALPFLIRGVTPEVADAELASRLQGYADKRGHVVDAYDELIEKLNEATKQAKAATEKAGKPKPTKGKAAPVAAASPVVANGDDGHDDDATCGACGSCDDDGSCGDEARTGATPAPVASKTGGDLFDF
ncbi:MAG: PRTRC system protein E [Campylobacterota bacterium]